jgi:hypothetical protein
MSLGQDEAMVRLRPERAEERVEAGPRRRQGARQHIGREILAGRPGEAPQARLLGRRYPDLQKLGLGHAWKLARFEGLSIRMY